MQNAAINTFDIDTTIEELEPKIAEQSESSFLELMG